jgi:hypothetical protein
MPVLLSVRLGGVKLVDTEHGFRRNLKAIRDRFRRFFQSLLSFRFSWLQAVRTDAAQADGEETG